MKLRSASNKDLEKIISWIPDEKSCRLWAGPGVNFPFTLDRLKNDINYLRYNTFSLIDVRGNLLGLGQIIEKENYLHLARIITSPSHRGKRIGKILCQELIREGRNKLGDRPFSLNVHAKNESALNLYLKLGFTPENTPAELTSSTENVYMILE